MSTPRDMQGYYDRLMSVEKDLYTPEELADLFDNITVDEVRGAVHRGQLKAITEGKHDRHIVGIHRADFLTWLQSGH